MKVYNNVDMKGRLYNFNLDTIDTVKGEAISGTVTLEVDEKGSTVEVRFFGYPTYSSGKPNRTYAILDDMIAGKYNTVVDSDEPGDVDWLALTGSVDVSYFVPNGGASSTDELARSQKIRGAFINANKKKEYQNKWKVDYYITKIDEVEPDEEKGNAGFVRVNGYIVDDYNKRANLFVTEAHAAAAMNYISGLPASIDSPYPVSTWGELATMTVKSIKKNAFGEDEVREFDNKKWVITGMDPEPYSFGEDNVMTSDQWKEIRANLEEYKTQQLEQGNDNAKDEEKPKLAF